MSSRPGSFFNHLISHIDRADTCVRGANGDDASGNAICNDDASGCHANDSSICNDDASDGVSNGGDASSVDASPHHDGARDERAHVHEPCPSHDLSWHDEDDRPQQLLSDRKLPRRQMRE